MTPASAARENIFNLKRAGLSHEEQWLTLHREFSRLASLSGELYARGDHGAALGLVRECSIYLVRLIELENNSQF